MSKTFRLICFAIIALGLFAILGCSNKKKEVVAEGNAVYYWRTTFRMNDYERNFIKEHNITKMYVRFFDVVENWDGKIMPVGTMIFIDKVPQDIEIVPTVYISSEAIARYEEIKDKLLARIEDMASANGVKYGEIQIDCDWTESSAEKGHRAFDHSSYVPTRLRRACRRLWCAYVLQYR